MKFVQINYTCDAFENKLLKLFLFLILMPSRIELKVHSNIQ